MKHIGDFQVESSLVICDPCYVDHADDEIKPIPAKPGKWTAKVDYDHGLVHCLFAKHQEWNGTGKWQPLKEAGVDSGQMSVNDSSITDITKEGFADYYEKCSQITLSHESYGVFGKTCVSSSGWGDGLYDVQAVKDEEGRVVAVRVEFTNSEECCQGCGDYCPKDELDIDGYCPNCACDGYCDDCGERVVADLNGEHFSTTGLCDDCYKNQDED